jgi:hypothetical protein
VKLFLALTILFTIPTVAAPHCVVVHNGICFMSQGQYDEYMGWGPEQQKLEKEANN